MKRHFFDDDEMPYYLASEVEEELEKARREGHDIPCHWCAQTRADERERIKRDYHRLRADHLAADAFDIAIGTRPAQEPKPLEKLSENAFELGGYVPAYLIERFNALVDAVNELRNGRR